jgi:hypothetical protein
MKEELDENMPTAKEMKLPEEFVYATRVVDVLRKVDLKKPCDIEESIRVVQKAFVEFRKKIENDLQNK